MKIAKGWRKISNRRGFLNENTGQTVVVAKKEFGLHYHVLLFAGERTKEVDGKKISPDYSTEEKAEAWALNWMKKNPNGGVEVLQG
jgi:hypothetical protein